MISHLKSIARLALSSRSYVRSTGWVASNKLKRPVDRLGNPIPWWTYPSISFIACRLPANLSIFEYGTGGSSVWLAGRATRVAAVEHDPQWVEETQRAAPANLSIIQARHDSQSYVDAIHASDPPFDAVVIDGRQRNKCAESCLSAISPSGVIVFDNSDRAAYKPGRDLIRDAGYRELMFEGLAPLAVFSSATSVFYRDNNVLGI